MFLSLFWQLETAEANSVAHIWQLLTWEWPTHGRYMLLAYILYTSPILKTHFGSSP